MKRYKLPDALGGGEVRECMTTVEVPKGWRAVGFPGYADPGGWLYIVPERALVEVPPPVPAEPEPGAYLIGGVLCVRFQGEDFWTLQNGGHDWPKLWAKFGGPDVTITPLVPALPEVELPWSLGWNTMPFEIDRDKERAKVRVALNRTAVYPTPDEAEEMAAALLSAARAARTKS